MKSLPFRFLIIVVVQFILCNITHVSGAKITLSYLSGFELSVGDSWQLIATIQLDSQDQIPIGAKITDIVLDFSYQFSEGSDSVEFCSSNDAWSGRRSKFLGLGDQYIFDSFDPIPPPELGSAPSEDGMGFCPQSSVHKAFSRLVVALASYSSDFVTYNLTFLCALPSDNGLYSVSASFAWESTVSLWSDELEVIVYGQSPQTLEFDTDFYGRAYSKDILMYNVVQQPPMVLLRDRLSGQQMPVNISYLEGYALDAKYGTAGNLYFLSPKLVSHKYTCFLYSLKVVQ